LGVVRPDEKVLEHVRVLPESGAAWKEASEAILRGELVVFPTDTVYGVGCDPNNADALELIYEAKGRPANKAVPLLLSDETMLSTVARELPTVARMLGNALWPGALTLVVHRNLILPPQLGQGDTIAARVPAHDSLRRFIASTGGAVAATSANLSGQPDALEVTEAVNYLGEHIAIYIDGGRSQGGTPSTVVDCTVTPVRILRQGAIGPEQVEHILGLEHGERA